YCTEFFLYGILVVTSWANPVKVIPMIVNNDRIKIPASIFLFLASGDLDAEKTTKNNPKELIPNATIAKLFFASIGVNKRTPTNSCTIRKPTGEVPLFLLFIPYPPTISYLF